MAYLPTDIANQALDAAAVDLVLGDIEEGTRQGQVCLRAYWQCLRQLLRAAPWDFARREAYLVLLADATGQTPNVGTYVPSNFMYEYEYPGDCARVRYIPWNPHNATGVPPGNTQPPNPFAPLTTGGTMPTFGNRVVPARYLVTNDPNYPSNPGQIYWETQGVSPQGRVVILTNIKNARVVYTTTVLYPSVWDHLFRSAMVAYLASEIAVPLAKDKKFAVQMRDHNIAIAKGKIMDARVADGNEMFASSDIAVDWMEARYTSGWGAGMGYGTGDGGGPGGFGCYGTGWAGSLSFANGSAF